jgi:hypothetical protein
MLRAGETDDNRNHLYNCTSKFFILIILNVSYHIGYGILFTLIINPLPVYVLMYNFKQTFLQPRNCS